MTAEPRPRAALLLVCALGVERRALRGGAPRAARPVQVLRTGMGPRAAARSVGAVLGDDGTAVLATGFCAGLAPAMRPGDVVVATEVAEVPDTGETAAGGAAAVRLSIADATVDALAQTLGSRGLTVHRGPLASSGHVIHGRERLALHTRGYVAADMESAAVLRTALAAGRRPVAAVRVVVDTPEKELFRLSTLRTGVVAFRTLRAAVPAYLDWQRTLAGTGSACTPDSLPHDPLSREVS